MIVIHCNAFIRPDAVDQLRDKLLEQMKDGLIVVPSYCGVYIDPQPGDAQVQVEEKKHCGNCKYGDRMSDSPPCYDCEDASYWEAIR